MIPHSRLDQSQPVDLRVADELLIGEITRRAADVGFCVVGDQNLGPAELDDLAIALGEPMFTPGESPLAGHTFVFEVTNRGRRGPPRSVMHSDTSYVDRPPALTVLAAAEVPHKGGDTLIINQYEAASSASPDLIDELDEVEFLHVASRVASPEHAGDGAWHAVLQRHPLTGRLTLYSSARERLSSARRNGVELPRGECGDLIDRVHAHATEFVEPRRHRWQSGDVLFIDNRCTLHAADHASVSGPRTLHRIMVRHRPTN